MLATLSIRDIVLIERLDLALGDGMTVLTGETGAGKSILLDALGLALGGRGDSGLVRHGADQGSVTARIELDAGHGVFATLRDNGIDVDGGELLLRRVQFADGRSRAFINDQPVSVGLLRMVGALVAEIHGQHDDRAFLDRDTHGRLLDAFGGLEGEAAALGTQWDHWKRCERERDEHHLKVERLARERDYLQHVVEELSALAPKPDEEGALAERRQLMMNAEKFADDLGDAEQALGGDGTLDATLSATLRRLERRRPEAAGALDHVCSAIERVLVELAEAKDAVARARAAIEYDPHELEHAEERLFALRAAARKHQTSVDGLPALHERSAAELESLDQDHARTASLDEACDAARLAYLEAARALSGKRHRVARDLDAQVMAELAPLKLDKTRFATSVDTVAAEQAGPRGLDRIEFTVATNPGSPPGALMKIASGGELARFILALKVVLAARGSAPTLIFDEVDTAVGGATADAIGARLSRLALALQVLAVTHSPQVAAQAKGHILISKASGAEHPEARAVTSAQSLDARSRAEEIARMLSGQHVTDEARAAARRLLGAAE